MLEVLQSGAAGCGTPRKHFTEPFSQPAAPENVSSTEFTIPSFIEVFRLT